MLLSEVSLSRISPKTSAETSLGTAGRSACATSFVLALFISNVLTATDITPRVGAIEIYGNRRASASKIKSALGSKPGDPLPAREDAEERINKVNGVIASRVEATCCSGRNLILYVGVEERDAPHIEFHPAPTENLKLADDTAGAYEEFIEAVSASIRDDSAAQDLTNGYSLMQQADANSIQQRFLPLVARDLPILDKVIRNAEDPEQRTMAAYLLQYTPRGPRTTTLMINALMYALQDGEDSVRENAMRSLKALAVGAKLHPEQQIHLEPTWFVELLNSPVWSDRHNASLALVELTEKRSPETLQLMRERALPSIIEMAKWQELRDALPPFLLVGRVAGLSEEQIRQAWVAGDREAVIHQALSPKRKFRIAAKRTT